MGGKIFARGPLVQRLCWTSRHVVQLRDAQEKVVDQILLQIRVEVVKSAAARA